MYGLTKVFSKECLSNFYTLCWSKSFHKFLTLLNGGHVLTPSKLRFVVSLLSDAVIH
jgi:hypothetical protein